MSARKVGDAAANNPFTKNTACTISAVCKPQGFNLSIATPAMPITRARTARKNFGPAPEYTCPKKYMGKEKGMGISANIAVKKPEKINKPARIASMRGQDGFCAADSCIPLSACGKPE